MDERSLLIITKQGDKTKEVAEYHINGDKVNIRFEGRAKIYAYSAKTVTIKQSPKSVAVTNQTVSYNGSPLLNVREMLDFGEKIKVFFQNQQTQVYDSATIRLEQPGEKANHLTCLLNYWKDISQYCKSDDESEAYLQKQFAKLTTIHQESALMAYVERKPIRQTELNHKSVIYPFRFNLSQKRALEQALQSPISVIEGPPGTGKTQTILNILANLTMMQNKSVAVVSSNNAAVQNVKDKLERDGYGFMAASLGRAAKREAFFKNLPQYDVSEWDSETLEEEVLAAIHQLSCRLEHLLAVSNRKAQVDQEIAAYHRERDYFQLHHGHLHLDEMARLFYRRQSAETIISFLADEYFADVRAFRFLHKAKLIFKYGFIDFKKLKRNRLELISRMQIKYYDLKLAELEQLRDDLARELDGAGFETLLKRHEELSSQLFKQKLFHKYKGRSSFQGNASNYIQMFEKFLEHFPILLSTTHALRSCIPQDFLFDYVIIDEASQVDLLSGVLAMSCCKHVIIVGDTKQLPQIVDMSIQQKLKTDQVDGAYSYFAHNLLSSILALYGEDVPKVMLREHYRCRSQIIGFCNQQFYNHELIPLAEDEEHEASIRLHYTAAGNHMRKVTRGKELGNFNQREIEVVKEEILAELEAQGISKTDVGFTTPYRLQVQEANDLLNEEIEIDTVHKYQGREKQVMVLSTVLDQTRQGKIGKRFVEDPCLVNVAVSRAQKQFILVTDHALFRNSRQSIGQLIRYIEYNTMHEHVTQSKLISVFDLLYSEFSSRLNEMHVRLKHTSRFKSESIMWTLLDDILHDDKYKGLSFNMQVHLKDIFRKTERLNMDETKYIRNRASFDFVVYDSLNKQPVLAIEVDGFASHRNNPDQQRRDKLKNEICLKYSFPLLRLKTTGSDEEVQIRDMLDRIV
ncbi:AAA family ATPase [Paenibacillus athensensis]|uniref:DNA helicase n=1 Tax=Paenibacillus athensensis TaxID=1967502 RepID=A0A4Y8QAC3_9BACL|nr:AAA domain-containing protein [Paenibacillus athensensis]MCD1260353.1 AAA family ATPase [Paenibacillus athensensis]